MPVWSDAERDRPIGWVLPDRRVAIVHELIPVIFELLAEIIQHRPCFMAGGAAQAIFASKCRQGISSGQGRKRKHKEQKTYYSPSGESHSMPPNKIRATSYLL